MIPFLLVILMLITENTTSLDRMTSVQFNANHREHNVSRPHDICSV